MRVLVVDGERDQRETLCRGLFLCGHQACAAGTPAEAALLLAGGGFDLLLTDVTSEADLRRLEVLRRLAPSLPMLITTGVATHAAFPGTPCLGKPFTPDDLDRAVRAAQKR